MLLAKHGSIIKTSGENSYSADLFDLTIIKSIPKEILFKIFKFITYY